MSGLKQKIFFLFDVLKINDLFIYLNRDKAIILCYHGISDDDFDLLKGYDERHITKSLFREQMTYLKNKGYKFVTLTDLIRKMKNRESVGKHVVLTFDDGFLNVINNAYPVMKETGAKGCIYVVSGLVGKGELLWTDMVESVIRNEKSGDFTFHFQGREVVYRLGTKSAGEAAMVAIKAKLRSISDSDRKKHMGQFQNKPLGNVSKEFNLANWEQLKTLDPAVMEVESHTKSHPNCTSLKSREAFVDELKDPKTDIEKRMGYAVEHFCYPGGAYNDETIKYLKEFGYVSATASTSGFVRSSDDVFTLQRIFVVENFLLFKAETSGSYYALSNCWFRIKGKTKINY